ncbi:DUF362 domain-containing protein [Deferribacter thermophilus]|uniref:DUF362 domain-containing protein n=1 Tax=Deferribacter thermophilus TaxID=53573 RepID=UPI003C2918AB
MAIIYYSSLENKKLNSPLDKIKKIFKKLKPEEVFDKGSLIAVKTHFGELGNTAFIRPIFLRPIIEVLKQIKVKPFLTDTNTLYVGMRTNSVDHLHNAFMNGFNYSTLQVPVIIADGLRGENSISCKIDGKLLKEVKLASDIVHSDGMVCVSHFKGHEVSGFGGAIKNLSMGCASREGKLAMHSVTRPKVHAEKCTACGLCKDACAAEAIVVKKYAEITDKCTGCARCIAVCPHGAIGINWDETAENTSLKMAEYAYGVSKILKGKILYINIATNISPACDCYPGNDKPVCDDIGFFASTDPVALDKACYDFVIKKLRYDPFKKIYNYIDPLVQLKHAEDLGLGSLSYELKVIK